MRICDACNQRQEFDGWECHSCGASPTRVCGFPVLAPELASGGDGFPIDSFRALIEVEERNFWFRARNRLLEWALRSEGVSPRRLLEIGCGTGYVLSFLTSRWPDAVVFGSDAFVAGLEFAATRVPSASLFQMDATRIPFVREFDLIVAADVIEHISRDDMTLSAIRGALRPGGHLLVTVPQHPELWSATDEFAHHKRRYRRSELLERVRDAGLEVRLCRSFNSLLYPLMRLSRLRNHATVDRDPLFEFRKAARGGALLEAVMSFERLLIRSGVNFPVGGSLLLLARAPVEPA